MIAELRLVFLDNVAAFVEEAIADAEHHLLPVDKPVSHAQPALQLLLDLQRKAGGEIDQAPVIEMREGRIQVKVKRRIEIIVGQLIGGIAIDPGGGRIHHEAFLPHTILHTIVQQVGQPVGGAVKGAR